LAVTEGIMLLKRTDRGLFCEQGDFYIDPWRPVDMAVITHAHSDHARPGSRVYLAEASGADILRHRLGPEARVETLMYGESSVRNGVKISLHPAGHILGSAQVRLEYGGEVWVVSGDYKVENDGIIPPLEPIRCHTFVTECTFGLPIYQWQAQGRVFEEINGWWRENQARGWTSVLFCYSLGKAQRLLCGLDASLGPIMVHGAVAPYVPAYEAAGVQFPPFGKADSELVRKAEPRGFVLAPTSAMNSPWLRKLGEVSTGFASGWMQIRGARRRRSLDRGFVLSDHADWPGLLGAIKATGAENVWVTHGYTGVMARWLNEHGYRAEEVETQFRAEMEEVEEAENPNPKSQIPRAEHEQPETPKPKSETPNAE
jgi:putative mRNA 3-end processing factor